MDSEDIAVKGILDHYIKRPISLEKICLAEFAAFYNFRKSGKTGKSNSNDLIDKSGFVTRRGRARIVRFRKYSKLQDQANFFREECMLYVSWRSEMQEVLKIDCQQKFNHNFDLIVTNRKLLHYNECSDSVDLAFEKLNDGEYEDMIPTSCCEISEDTFDIYDEISGKKKPRRLTTYFP